MKFRWLNQKKKEEEEEEEEEVKLEDWNEFWSNLELTFFII